MLLDFTVVIPTYNGASRLPEVLELLRSQLNTDHINWEIIIINNNSTDHTDEIIKLYQLNWDKKYPLKYDFEPQQGAGFARKKAIEISNSNLIGFLDDDNLPDKNWVFAAYDFAQKHPQAGAYGSQIHPLYTVNPPPNFHRIAPYLAINERGDQPLLYHKNNKLLPPSAGLVIRKSVWLENVPDQQILTGSTNNNMLSSEDLEMLSYIQNSNYEIWYNPAMKIYHKIPEHRLTKDYLIPFLKKIGYSRYITRMIGVKLWQKPFMFILYMLNDLRKIITHLLKYRFAVQSDLIAMCELTLFWSSLISPFYLWKNKINTRPLAKLE